MIETAAACAYCISNIRSDKLARRKHRIGSQEFAIGESGVTLDNIDSVAAASRLQQQRNATLTHILTNNSIVQRDIQPTHSTADNAQLEATREADEQASALRNEDRADSVQILIENESCGGATATVTASTNHAVDSSKPDESLTASQTLVHTASDLHEQTFELNNDRLRSANQSTTNLTYIISADDSHSSSANSPSYTSSGASNAHEATNQSRGFDAANSPSADRDAGSSDSAACVATNSSNVSPSHNTIEDDLINLQSTSSAPAPTAPAASSNLAVSDSTEMARRKSAPSARQRAAHLRRTMVLGLSGEEEMIEIDEDDLDNESVLPPSYESISTCVAPLTTATPTTAATTSATRTTSHEAVATTSEGAR